MLSIIKILFFVIAGIFLVSILNENPVSLSTRGSGSSNLEAPSRDVYLRSYDRNRDGVVSDEEFRLGELARVTEEVGVLTKNMEEALRAENRSPYADTISLRSSRLSADDEDEEYVTIVASNRLSSPVNISGWKLKSLLSEKVRSIPRGTTHLASTRAFQTSDNIFLGAGDSAVVLSGNVAGIRSSFLTNKCTGYLEENHDFVPGLFAQCPRLSEENLSAYNISPEHFRNLTEYDSCIDAIEDVQSCREGHPSSDVPSRCRTFIHDYSDYEGCYKLHQFDSDFLGDEWRIFLGSTADLWRSDREAVALIDGNGKVVDVLEK